MPKIRLMKRRNADADDDTEEDQQPPKKMTCNINGQKREYNLLKTVNSLEELDKFRFKNYCVFNGCNRRQKETFKSNILPCKLKKEGKGCDFELRAVRPDLKNGTIHVYIFSKHNHPMISDERQQSKVGEEEDEDELEEEEDDEDGEEEGEEDDKLREEGTEEYEEKGDKRDEEEDEEQMEEDDIIVLEDEKQQKQEEGEEDNEEEEEEEQEREDKDIPMEMEAVEEGEAEEVEEEKDEDEEKKDIKLIVKEEQQQEGDEEVKEEEEVDEEKKDIKLIVKNEQVQQETEEERLERLMEVKIIEIIEGNTREKTLKKKLAKANEKVYKWMAGIGPTEIEETIGEWDKLSLLKMVEMADQGIREHPQKHNLWLPWMKCAIFKCLPQIDGFNVRFKDLIKLIFN